MRVSLEWLKDYVEVRVAPQELADRLTMAGIAVESMENSGSDTILELELTPNRGDCNGLINVAREVAAVFSIPLHLPRAVPEETDEEIEDFIKVTVKEPELCRRYALRLIRNIRIAPSPRWMQERLEKAGIRPINNIVDITNYVMLETNQPLHAFDYDLLEDAHIVVRCPEEGEKIHTLDGNERELDLNMLVIADSQRPVALAGVMGGGNSEINQATTNVLLESANFDAVSIRKTSKKLALRTESSLRFEKGVDIEGVTTALNRAACLIEVLGAGEVVGGIYDVYPVPWQPDIIKLRPDRLNRLLGTQLGTKEIRGYLKRLQFSVEEGVDGLTITVPSYRPDISIEEDLVEEVARLYGYDNIPSHPSRTEPTQGYRTAYQSFRDQLIKVCSRWMYQVITYSFINPRWLDHLFPKGHKLQDALKVANPFSEEQGVMRTTLVPGLLEAANRNLARRNENLALFEMGNIFRPSSTGLPDEVLTLAGLVTGKIGGGWQKAEQEMDFYYLKGIVEGICHEIGLREVVFEPQSVEHIFHPGRTAVMLARGVKIGMIGEIHPRVLENVGLKKRSWIFEMDVPTLFRVAPSNPKISEISRYPAVKRDLALVVPEATLAADLLATIREAGGEKLKKVEIFDLYRSPQLGEGVKSLALALGFQSYEGTLQDEEVTRIMEEIIDLTRERHQARLR